MLNCKVVVDGKIIKQQVIGIWRDPETNELHASPGSCFGSFYDTGEALDNEYNIFKLNDKNIVHIS